MRTISFTKSSLATGLLLISLLVASQAHATGGGGGSCSPYYGSWPACTPPIIIGVATLSASPNPILTGQSTTLTWTCGEATGFSDATSGMLASSNFWSGTKGYPYTDNSEAYGGTVVVTPSGTTEYWVTCTPTWNAGSTVGASATTYYTVVTNTLADVYTGSVSPTTAITNSPVTLSATVSNQGGLTASSFPNSFYISGIGYVASQALTLASGGSSGISASYTFTSAGSYSVLACADRNTGGVGVVTESDEDNNCGSAWTTITVSDPLPQPPTGLSASCNAAGTSVTFNWNAMQYATFYYFRNDDQQISSCGSWYCQDPPDVLPAVGTNSYTINGTVPGHTNSWWVHSANNAGYSNPTYSSIVCSGQPDLTPGSATTPATGTAGTPVSFTSGISNAGTGASGAFTSTLWIDTDQNLNNGMLSYPQLSSATIAAGGTGSVNTSYTFSSAGTYYTILCVDNTSSWVGTVTESNENNNCGSWTPITISAPATQCANGIDDDGDGSIDLADAGCSNAADNTESPNPPTASLSANPTTISSGSSSTLTWGSSGSGVTSCTGVGFTAGGSSGTRSVSPTTPGANQYGVYCTNSAGNSATVYTSVTVITPSAYIISEPTLVDGRGSGGSANLKWSAADATFCDITRSQGSPTAVLTDAVPSATTTTAVSGITRQTRFTITCDTTAGSTVTSSVLVNVIPTSTEF